ncbi:MAG: TetR/AcrR family transcriptional regulator [Bacteroidales bacterium]|jgi:AcrR family transcriptional regulator|nr:TetR/AcrR family transcriptional regulator [Bacteroidales bacterium]
MRIADDNKIKKLEQATIAHVVHKGYGGASVAEIARTAGVSKGYLYRFHKNKHELVQALLTRYINSIIKQIEEGLKQNISVDLVLTSMIDYIFGVAKKHPNHLKFVYVLLHDYNFQLETEQKLKIKTVIQRFYEIGVSQNLVNKAVTAEEIFTIVVIYPIDFINLRYKQFFETAGWNNDDIERVSTFCSNALKS